MPAQSRHSNNDHADRQRNYPRSQRPYPSSRDSLPNRGREPIRGRSNFSQARGGFQDQSRRTEGARAPSHPSALPVRRQQPTGTSSLTHQYPRPAPPIRQNQGEQEFDPNILSGLVGLSPLQLLGQAPSFAPDAEEPSHKRTHEQMQQMPPMALLTPDLIQSLQQMRQQPQQQQRHPHQQQAWPGGQPNGTHMPPHSMMGPVIPPPRPPQGPPPPGQPPNIPHSASLFGPPHFGVMSSSAMDGRPYQGPPQDPQGSRLRQGGPGWSLSHGMDGSDRSGNRQEPMLAADMVWDSDAGQGHSSSQSAGGPRGDPFRGHMAGQRNGVPGPGPYSGGPRMAAPRAPAPMQNKAAEAAKNQAALAAAKARFEQQQKENDEIAERSKRQRLGLPEPRPPVRETEIERLKRQIAEKEAAKKAARAQTPTVTKSAPPSPAKGRAPSMSPSPSSLPEGSTPPSTSGKGHRLQSSVVRVQPSPPIDHNDRWRPHDEGQSRSRDTGRASKSVEADGRGRRTAEDSSHKHHDHRGASRDSSRDRGHRDRHREEHHRSQRNSSTQRSDVSPSQGDMQYRDRRDPDHGRER
ncbi:hypothetical protein ABBQ38_002582 [Trebouxia sp. C0009 RCD-2024]